MILIFASVVTLKPGTYKNQKETLDQETLNLVPSIYFLSLRGPGRREPWERSCETLTDYLL